MFLSNQNPIQEITPPEVSVMLVDDSPAEHLLFKSALQIAGLTITCTCAWDGEEALRTLLQQPVPKILFVDINMPKMNGFSLLEKIRMLQHLRHVPTIIYSTSEEPKEIEKARSMGATCFLTKPPFPELVAALQYLVGKDDAVDKTSLEPFLKEFN